MLFVHIYDINLLSWLPLQHGCRTLVGRVLVKLDKNSLLRLVSDDAQPTAKVFLHETYIILIELFTSSLTCIINNSHSQDFMNSVCTHIVRLDMTYKKLRY